MTEKKKQKPAEIFFAYHEPENHTRKGKKKNGNSEEKEITRRKKAMAALSVFLLSSLKTAFERETTVGWERFTLAVKLRYSTRSNRSLGECVRYGC